MTRSVLVTDAGRTSAIACLRSFGRAGWRVIAADCDPRSAGFSSRFAAERFLYPPPERSPRAFVEALHDFLGAQRVDLVVPVTDECIHPLAHARERFAALTTLAIASDAALAAVTDKRATLALAEGLGVPMPATRVVTDVGEARAGAEALGFPLVVKPAISRHYLPAEDRIERGTVSFARDPAELERRVAPLLLRQVVLLQRYESGEGIGVECLARDGHVQLAFQHRRLAEIPLHGGTSAWRESVALDPELLAHTVRLIGALSWTGLIMVEFKRGRRPWMLEVNGRIWGSLPLACLAGVDFPAALGELLVPERGHARELITPLRASYRLGVRAYNFELMLSWIAQVLLGRSRHPFLPRPGRERALAGLVGLLDPSQKSDLAGPDFAPRLAEARRIARRIARRFAGKLAHSTGEGG